MSMLRLTTKSSDMKWVAMKKCMNNKCKCLLLPSKCNYSYKISKEIWKSRVSNSGPIQNSCLTIAPCTSTLLILQNMPKMNQSLNGKDLMK